MSYSEVQVNLENFINLVKQAPASQDEHMNALINFYTSKNITLLNDMLQIIMLNLKKLHQSNSVNEVICTQSLFSSDIYKKISSSREWFLSARLKDINSEYDEWVLAHCDLATD